MLEVGGGAPCAGGATVPFAPGNSEILDRQTVAPCTMTPYDNLDPMLSNLVNLADTHVEKPS